MAKFAEMPTAERNQWVAWANAHDWGAFEGGKQKRAHFDETTGELVTYALEFAPEEPTEAAPEEKYVIVEGRHTTPKALRDWAGY